MSILSKTCDPKRCEKLERAARYPSVYNKWKGRMVRIYSTEWMAYWRPEAAGYTDKPEQAGVWPFEKAFKMTEHCGPEKGIEFYVVDNEAPPSHSSLVGYVHPKQSHNSTKPDKSLTILIAIRMIREWILDGLNTGDDAGGKPCPDEAERLLRSLAIRMGQLNKAKRQPLQT